MARWTCGISAPDALRAELPCSVLDDIMNLQYTSGTTGFPKLAITTHEYWLVLGKFSAQLMTEDDLFLTLSPFYYMDPQWSY